MSIVTGKMLPDEGKVEVQICDGWPSGSACCLEQGQSVRDVLRTAFDELFKTEARINEIS